MPRKSARSFIQLFVTNVVTKACWALILLLLLRKLGAASFGVLATLWSAAAIAAGFVDFGTGQAVLREGSRDHAIARHLAAQSARVQAVLTIATAALLSIGGWWILTIPELSATERAWVIVLGVATPLIDRFQALFTVCSQIGGNYNVYSRTRSTYFVILLLAEVWTLYHGGGLLDVSMVYFGLTLVFNIVMGIGTWSLLPTTETASKAPSTRTLLRQGLPFVMVMGLALAYGRIDVTILGVYGHSAAAGSYHVIYQLVLLVYSVSGMFFTVVYPRLYRHRGDRATLSEDFRDSVRWLSLLGWLAAPPLWLFAEPILRMMGGQELADYATVLRVLAVMILFIPASASLNFLLPTDRLHTRVFCDGVGIVLNVCLASWAASHNLPDWVAAAGVMGYAIAISLSHVALRKVMVGSSRKLLAEFSQIGLRVLPCMGLAWWMPGPWWMRMVAFAILSATAVYTYHPIRQRMHELITPVNQ